MKSLGVKNSMMKKGVVAAKTKNQKGASKPMKEFSFGKGGGKGMAPPFMKKGK